MTNIEESNFEKNLVALVTEFLVDQKLLYPNFSLKLVVKKVTKFCSQFGWLKCF